MAEAAAAEEEEVVGGDSASVVGGGWAAPRSSVLSAWGGGTPATASSATGLAAKNLPLLAPWLPEFSSDEKPNDSGPVDLFQTHTNQILKKR